MNLKTFNFYQYVKDKMPWEAQESFFYANNETYRDLRVDFPFRTTHYGIGINYGPGSSQCRLGSTDYMLKDGSLTTLGPGIITCWKSTYDLKNETVFFPMRFSGTSRHHRCKPFPFLCMVETI